MTSRQLTPTGIPVWAPYRYDDAPHFYAWIDDGGVVRSKLLGSPDRLQLRQLRDQCERLLGGAVERPNSDPADLSEMAALIAVGSHGVGYGPISRNALLPLRDLLAFASAALNELHQAAGD